METSVAGGSRPVRPSRTDSRHDVEVQSPRAGLAAPSSASSRDYRLDTNLSLLEANAVAYGTPNVTAIEVCLVNEDGTVEFHVSSGAPRSILTRKSI